MKQYITKPRQAKDIHDAFKNHCMLCNSTNLKFLGMSKKMDMEGPNAPVYECLDCKGAFTIDEVRITDSNGEEVARINQSVKGVD